jgi:MFS family permease
MISSIGVFMAAVSTSALIIAFPVLIEDLDITISTMMWILLCVLLLIAAVVGIAGKLGDIFGQATLYKFGYIVFIIGCLGGGFAKKENKGMDLIAVRVVIGFGAAFLFTNSSAILTNAFAPYNLVGLSQGVFQLSSAMGTVLGPLIGGAFAQTNWRWIFFFNVPLGGPCALLALWVVQDKKDRVSKSFAEHAKSFDWIGAVFYPIGLVLYLTAMIQGVSPTPPLSQTGPLTGLLVAGTVAGSIFIADQFIAEDPIFPPSIFFNSKVFTLSTIGGTCMGFIRNSIMYNMIFYLQGPHGMDPFKAGIALIPYGIGTMVAGFSAGALADKVGVRIMTGIGPIIIIAAVSSFTSFKKDTSAAEIGGLLFLAGVGVGFFNSPNAMSNMLSVKPHQRGVASAMGMMTLMFTSMAGIVITFSLVLNSMSQAELFLLFIYGGSGLSQSAVDGCLNALRTDFYIVIAFCCVASFCGFNNDFVTDKTVTAKAATITQKTAMKDEDSIIIDIEEEKALDSEGYMAVVGVAGSEEPL